MAIYYIDYVNGSDANTGADWANAWKTLTLGATAARIAAGDTIRIAKSSDPTSCGINATWTDGSATVTLASALTANIDMGAAAWTAANGATAAKATGDEREGNDSSKVTAPAVPATDTLYAYMAFAGTDFSAYQQISFWIYCEAAIAATNWVIKLCSDNAGAVAVDTFTIPACSNGFWIPITIDNAGALGNSIQSVALYSGSVAPTASKYVKLDNIIACKASASADSLTLTSLISKASQATGYDEGWYAIRSINGTTVILSNSAVSNPTAGNYYGTTEAVALYKREPVVLTSNNESVEDSGTSETNLISYEFGFNTATTEQDGETFLDGRRASSMSFTVNGKNYISLNKFSLVGFRLYLNNITYLKMPNIGTITASYNSGIVFNGAIYGCVGTTWGFINNNGSSSLHSGITGVVYGLNVTTIKQINGNLKEGLNLAGMNIRIGTINTICRNSSDGWDPTASYLLGNVEIGTIGAIKNNGGFAFNTFGFPNFIVHNITSASNTSGFATMAGGKMRLYNASIGEAGVAAFSTSYVGSDGRVCIGKFGGDVNDNRVYCEYGTITSQTTTRHTASGVAWKFSPTNVLRNVTYPLNQVIARIAVNADSQVTVTGWFQRSNTGLTGQLLCRGGQLAGVASDVSDSITADADTWEQLSISFTPTEAGVIEIEALCYGGTTYSMYVDDLSISQV